jgi:two-component system, NtrC family, sensor kinase
VVRPGLRVQILVLLGALLAAAFLPLYFAVSTYARFTLHEVRAATARALGRAIAGQVAEARGHRSAEELAPLLEAQVGATGVEAVALCDQNGRVTTEVGAKGALASIGNIDPTREAVLSVTTPHGRAIAVVVPDAQGAVLAVLRTDPASAGVEPLVELSGLYMGLVALALLVVLYFALTRLIVSPLDELSRSAVRVAGGARRLDVPHSGSRELIELSASLRTMTEKLLAEEEALRHKIDEVERATTSLRETQDHLVRSERLASVGRLAAGLAHEVGNPIAAIVGMQDLLLTGDLDRTEERDFLVRMRAETERINKILRDLLDFARPGDKGLQKPDEPGNVEAAIHDTVALMAPQKSMYDIEVSIDVHPDLPLVALSREHQVQVFLNLLLNAADACRTGGHVKVTAERSEIGVRVLVEDDGTGISPEVRDRLFEPFVTTKEVGKGTGLGLAVCRGLVEASGGTIRFDANTEKGARFVVEIPAARGALSS